MAADQGDGARPKAVFDQCRIAFVPSRQLPTETIVEFSHTAQKHGATILEPRRNGRINLDEATHIIANSIDFEDFNDATTNMVPVVNSAWLLHSLERKKQAQLRPFSPDPRMIFSNINLTCADIPSTDKDAIIGATLALGGMESKDLSRLTTHICAVSLEHEKCRQAKEKNLKCKIVLPHWFDDCFKLGKKIDEGPYLLPDPAILRPGAEDEVQIPSSQHMEGATSTLPDVSPFASAGRRKPTVFDQKRIMLSWDLCISKRFRPIVADLIQSGGGVVVEDVELCDMFICQYRDGEQYVRAAQCGKDVGNLAWLFYLITHNEWCSPMRRLLHYPIPRNGIPGFENYKITLSNYGGEARIYLENLIRAAGGTFTKTMKAENTHLITARNNSEKCEAAKDWNIDMVNHLWIEESYAQCEVQRLTNSRYTTFPSRTNLGEVIGQTFFDEAKLRAKYYPGGEETLKSAPKRKRKALQAVEEFANTMCSSAGAASPIGVLRDEGPTPARNKTQASDRPSRAQAARDFATPARGRHVRSGKENDTPSVTSTGSRSAKEKAAMKIHFLAPDIALYEKEKKRSSKDAHAPWGGKRAATQIDREREAAKASSPAPETADEDDEDEDIKRPPKKQKPSLPQVAMKIMLTGFTRWLNEKSNEDKDRRKLRSLGIQIVQEGQPCDYLAAPSVVRTTKFLTTMARGPGLIDSKFIDDVLDTGELLDVSEYPLKDTKHGIDLEQCVERARAHKGKLLWKMPIYCTEDVKNGVDCYQAIATANGAIFMVYRARSGTTIKPTTAEEDGGAPPEPVYLITGSSEKDRKLWPKFEKMAREGNMEPRIVFTDWLLNAALTQEVTYEDRFKAQKYFEDGA